MVVRASAGVFQLKFIFFIYNSELNFFCGDRFTATFIFSCIVCRKLQFVKLYLLRTTISNFPFYVPKKNDNEFQFKIGNIFICSVHKLLVT
jgi:hypothetical protein